MDILYFQYTLQLQTLLALLKFIVLLVREKTVHFNPPSKLYFLVAMHLFAVHDHTVKLLASLDN